jgi:hypothetical protein
MKPIQGLVRSILNGPRFKSSRLSLDIKIFDFNDDLFSSLQVFQVSHFGHKCHKGRRHHTIILSMTCLKKHQNDTSKTPSKTGLRRRNHLMKSKNIFP